MHHIFSILAVLRDVVGNAEDVAVVTPHQLFESINVAALCAPYQRQFFGSGVSSSCGLDGRCHWGIHKNRLISKLLNPVGNRP